MESVRSFDASQYSDGHSISSDENLFQLPDLDKNLPHANHSSRQSFSDSDSVDSEVSPSHIEEENDENLEDHWREVRCVESADITSNKATPSTMTESSPNPYIQSNASSPSPNTGSSGLTVVDNGENADSVSSRLKEDKKWNNFYESIVISSREKISPRPLDTYRSRRLKLHKSRSCEASLMMDSPSYWFDKEKTIETKTPIRIESELTASPDGFQQKVYTLNNNANAERQSKNDSRNPDKNASIDEVLKVENSIDIESEEEDLVSKNQPIDPNEKEDFVSINQSIDHKEKEDLISVNQSIDHKEKEDPESENETMDHEENEDLVSVNQSIEHKVCMLLFFNFLQLNCLAKCDLLKLIDNFFPCFKFV